MPDEAKTTKDLLQEAARNGNRITVRSDVKGKTAARNLHDVELVQQLVESGLARWENRVTARLTREGRRLAKRG